ncbi:MAG: hypothetical protein OSB65_16650 [Roseibacillus sp.]|nr:hypothetical protein [Roseibacillus sp.]
MTVLRATSTSAENPPNSSAYGSGSSDDEGAFVPRYGGSPSLAPLRVTTELHAARLLEITTDLAFEFRHSAAGRQHESQVTARRTTRSPDLVGIGAPEANRAFAIVHDGRELIGT